MDAASIIMMIEEHIITPALIAFGGIILGMVKHYAEKISKSIEAKNEMSNIEKQATLRNQLIQTISEAVKAAVASNMDTAKKMKIGGNKLTDEQIAKLNQSAINIVLASLPPALTEDGGSLLEVIGSKEKLNNLINAFLEKYVYEYKSEDSSSESCEQTYEEDNKNTSILSENEIDNLLSALSENEVSPEMWDEIHNNRGPDEEEEQQHDISETATTSHRKQTPVLF